MGTARLGDFTLPARIGISGGEGGGTPPPPVVVDNKKATPGSIRLGDFILGSVADWAPSFVLSVHSVSATGVVSVVAKGYGTTWTSSNPFSLVSGPASGLTSYSNTSATSAAFSFTVTGLTGRVVIRDSNSNTTQRVIADGLTYYVNATGSDANSGQSTLTPFATIAGALAYFRSGLHAGWKRGITVNLNGGDTFTNQILVEDGVSGANASDLITFQSYGTGQAILSQSSRVLDVISARDCGGVKVDNLDIRGNGTTVTDSNQFGFRIDITAAHAGTDIQAITVTNCEIQSCRIGVGCDPQGMQLTPIHTNGIQITNNIIHDCWLGGVWFHNNESHGIQTLNDAATLNHTGIQITGNEIYDIDGGGAPGLGNLALPVLLGSTNNCLIQGNVIHDADATSGVNGAAVVILVSDAIITRGNEVYNVFGSADGSGIDIDHGSSNCVTEYNYVHDCEGSGIIAFEFAVGTRPAYATRVWTNNVFRYNVVQNCADKASSPWAAFSLVGDNLQNGIVYNNTFAHTAGGGNRLVNAYTLTTGNTSGWKFLNNIFIGSTSSVKLIEIAAGLTGVSAADFEWKNNIFYTNAGSESIEYPSGNYTSVADWESANSSTVAGNIHDDPELNDAFTAVTFGDASSLPTLTKVTPSSSSSPAVNAGIDVNGSPYSYGVTRDYKGTTTPIGSFDIGAIEFQASGSARPKTRGLAGGPVIGSVVG